MRISGKKNGLVLKQRIIDHILDHIIAGTWPSGHRLPTRVEFEKKFSTTAVTVNRAFEPLVQDGFLTTAGKKGTFVSSNLPHFCNFAIVFTETPPEIHRELAYNHAIHLAEKQVGNQKEIKLINYYNFIARPDNPVYKKLYDDIINRRLAGVFFTHWPEALMSTPLLDIINIPLVTIHSKPLNEDIFSINISFKPVWEKAVNYFALQKCRRMALITVPFYLQQVEYFQKCCAEAGIELLTEHIQFAEIDTHNTAKYCTRLLFSQPPERRPDCLYIMDDNLVESSLEGITGVLNEQEANSIKIAFLANFPNEFKFKLSVAMFGYDTVVLLHNVIELLRSSELRENTPKHQNAPEDNIRSYIP